MRVDEDYKLARYLAFREMQANENESPLEGSSILLMLYANGFGVKQNLELAIRLACGNVGGADAEVEGRLQQLKAMQAGEDSTIFDYCDHATSGYVSGFCQGIISELDAIAREKKIDSILKKWTEKERTAYRKLNKVADDLFNTAASYEVDWSGTARVAMAEQYADALNDSFANRIALASKCSFKKYTAAEFAAADKQLNALYGAIIKRDDPAYAGAITTDGIKKVQRQWLIYRDAWVAFGKIKCPQISAETWKTILTLERISQLKNLSLAE